MDVNSTFLNGEFEEEVYIEQPDGFVIHGKESHVCKLKKTLYGLKQAHRYWYSRIDTYIHKPGSLKSDVDSNMYFKVVENQPMILVLYVDDIFLTREERPISECQREITSYFEMKDLGLMCYFLGLDIWQRNDEIFLSQGKYIVDILHGFGIVDCKSMNTPMDSYLRKPHETEVESDLVDPTLYRQLIGSLMYLIHLRP